MTQTAALLLWGILLILFVVIEATSVQLLSIWFALGSLAALILAACGVTFWVQVVTAIVVSGAVLIAMRPIAKKFKEKNLVRLNADRTIGRHGVVTVEINNLASAGMIRVGSTLWTARAASEEEVLPVGTRVTVERIEGVKAIVRRSRDQGTGIPSSAAKASGETPEPENNTPNTKGDL